jgi:hypothetical protein
MKIPLTTKSIVDTEVTEPLFRKLNRSVYKLYTLDGETVYDQIGVDLYIRKATWDIEKIYLGTPIEIDEYNDMINKIIHDIESDQESLYENTPIESHSNLER